ncbi:GntR family transcriptional regulator [Streptomyces sp. NPDC001388]|uniref:GntR family transcriptional regulator n=1 Tax=unclassified Streptomyces TaxID=2593676 RepID=UPI0036A33692
MPERKYDRPTRLKTIELPGSTASDANQAHEDFVGHIRAGLAERRYVFGDILPTVSDVRDQYGLPEDDIHRAIRELRNDGLLQLHDSYRDTYFLDPGPDAGEARA